MTSVSNTSLIDDELREAHAKSALEHAKSNPARIPCPGPQKTQNVIDYIATMLLPTMTRLAQANYRNGDLADCTVNVENLRPRRHELIEYCRDNHLKLPDALRDQSGNAPIGDWLALMMTYLALPNVITVRSFEEGMDNVPYIRLALS